MAVLPKAQTCWRSREFPTELGKSNGRILPCCIAKTWLPTIHWPPHTATAGRPATHHVACKPTVHIYLQFDVLAAGQAPMLCLWNGTHHQVYICKSGADALTCPAKRRAPLHLLRWLASRTPRRPVSPLRYVFCPQLHCLALVSRALARSTPSYSGHHGQLPCMTLHADDRAERS